MKQWVSAQRARGLLVLLAVVGASVGTYDRLVVSGYRHSQALKDPQQIVDAFHALAHRQYTGDANSGTSKWCGVVAAQNPNDVWITQEIISEVRPELIIETGTAMGGSAVIWAMILEQVQPSGRVLTIDIDNRVDETTKPPIARSRIDYLVGDSTAPAVISEARRRAQNKRTMVILDSDHRKDHVLAELVGYAPLVTLGSYLIVQDTNVNGHPVLPAFGPGPMEALKEFLSTDQRFESDPSRERLLFTMNPRGYLKRVR